MENVQFPFSCWFIFEIIDIFVSYYDHYYYYLTEIFDGVSLPMFWWMDPSIWPYTRLFRSLFGFASNGSNILCALWAHLIAIQLQTICGIKTEFFWWHTKTKSALDINNGAESKRNDMRRRIKESMRPINNLGFYNDQVKIWNQ